MAPTLGHYLMIVYDPLDRCMKTLEDGGHLASLNELGCGALAGTSWPIDRDLISAYLGCEGSVENSNEAGSASGSAALLAMFWRPRTHVTAVPPTVLASFR
jgi:argininosuccinate lyase